MQVTTGGVSSWETVTSPEIPKITAGGTFPDNPSVNDLHFATAAITSNVPDNIRQADGTTQATAVAKGDIYQFELIQSNDVWVFEGNLDTAPL